MGERADGGGLYIFTTNNYGDDPTTVELSSTGGQASEWDKTGRDGMRATVHSGKFAGK